MSRARAGQPVLLLAHPAARRSCCTVLSCALAGVLLATLGARLAPHRLSTWLDVAILLLAFAVAPVVAEPSGAAADAAPTPLAARRLVRGGAAVAVVGLAWALALAALPASLRPPAGLPTAQLAALTALVLALAAATARLRSPADGPIGGVVGAAMLWVGAALVPPATWPLPGGTSGQGALAALAVVLAAVFLAFCVDPHSPVAALPARLSSVRGQRAGRRRPATASS